MRHPHGLRAVTSAGVLAIGDAYQGGFFAGYISHTANGVATHGLIVAPAASGSNGGATLQWKTTNTTTSGTTSVFNGATNSANMNNASHPAAQYCEGRSIGGYTDWYLPALYELDIAYENLKPTTDANQTIHGFNPYSVPNRTANRTAGAPAQTSIVAFQAGGVEAFATQCWTSTEHNFEDGLNLRFQDGRQFFIRKITLLNVRAFRKFAL